MAREREGLEKSWSENRRYASSLSDTIQRSKLTSVMLRNFIKIVINIRDVTQLYEVRNKPL